jgi:hypothetical protein
MRIARSGRFVFVAQWFLTLLLFLFAAFGRGFVGSPLGWMAVVAIWIGLPLLLAMYLPPVLTLFDRDVRAAKATRAAYAVSSWVLWAALVFTGIVLVDGGDDGVSGSALTVWTGGAIGTGTSYALMLFGGLLVIAAWTATAVAAIAGIVRSRGSRSTAPAERSATA